MDVEVAANLAQLRSQGHRVSATLVGRLLHEAGYSLQANSKTLEGARHPDRDAQFRHIHDAVAAALAAGMPVISVDCKKKELVGQYKNNARDSDPSGSVGRRRPRRPRRGRQDDPLRHLRPGLPKTGWVTVGIDHETAAFAVNTVRAWWNTRGRHDYPHTDQL